MTTTVTTTNTPNNAASVVDALLDFGKEILGQFSPAKATDPATLVLPATLRSQDDRRAFALLSAHLFAAQGDAPVAIAWRVKHAEISGVISKPSMWRFRLALLGPGLVDAEIETRTAIRHLASLKVQQELLVEARRNGDALESLVIEISKARRAAKLLTDDEKADAKKLAAA